VQYNHPVVQRALLVALCACSPYGAGSFTCETDSQCGADGTCSDGFCSFPDNACPSGLRYGDRSGPLSNQCVGGGGDSGTDTPPGDNANCFGTGLVVACFSAAPSGDQMLATSVIVNTDTSPQCATLTNGNNWCVIAAHSITINTGVTVAATGMRPLVLVATESITMSGLIDVASHRGVGIGAGADAPGCNEGSPPTGTSGGAGGSFGGAGGDGAAVGGNAGTAGATIIPTMMRGGCPGQNGSDDTAPGPRGHGGGGVMLIANNTITIGGIVNASGSGGGGGGNSANAGAGGGGSGGLIGLDAPTIMVSGVVVANGGGGGEASGAVSTGDVGDDPTNATTPALGGSGGSSFGTDGGNGAYATTLTGDNAATNCTGTCTTPSAGGGGGGGAGLIKHYRATSIGGSGTISPPAS
jgi:hypothetical protein